jgi:hypothetical protein
MDKGDIYIFPGTDHLLTVMNCEGQGTNVVGRYLIVLLKNVHIKIIQCCHLCLLKGIIIFKFV